MKLTHSNIITRLNGWLRGQAFIQVKVSNLHWVPDSAFLNPSKTAIYIYEVKTPRTSYCYIRQGLIQALEGAVYGFVSYLVVSSLHLSEIDKLLPFLPQLGVITYSDSGDMSIVKEAEVPLNAEDITKKLLSASKTKRLIDREIIVSRSKLRLTFTKKNKQKYRGITVKVKAYSYIRKGKCVHSPAYTRKRPDIKSYSTGHRQKVLKIREKF